MMIESVSNPLVKYAKKLKDKKYRKTEQKYLVEGITLCTEFMQSCPQCIDSIFVTQDKACTVSGFENLTFTVTDRVLSAICDTETPQGIVIVAKTEPVLPRVQDMKLVVYLDRVKDPGNVGTIIRSADAFGADMVVLSANCADLYNPKTVRSTMGSMFHIPILTESVYLEWIDRLKQNEFQVVVGSLNAEEKPQSVDFMRNKTVICLGNEAHGVSQALLEKGVWEIKIPMSGRAESLNVAIAGSVLLYEAIRQREDSV